MGGKDHSTVMYNETIRDVSKIDKRTEEISKEIKDKSLNKI